MLLISQVLPLIELTVKELQPKEEICIKTYKKDRVFFIFCMRENRFQLIENGFYKVSFIGNLPQMKRQSKKSLKREFPRSNKAWFEFHHYVESPHFIKVLCSTQISVF
ncbi:hypothetical protein [Aliivibrio fischeri]|uniref:hypothetical protein n=1 Tax=Aliivibrio fischeri TaxID=668 RepID=UPI00080DF61B|nr:hypothetical protein [Aliivibrio fischeri]OCH43080.1 hypothetical protein A6D99_00430 [Aliivibrio fischeri]